MTVSLTPMVKALLIINGLLWVLTVFILQQFFFKDGSIFLELGLSPISFIYDLKVWQPFTYMFLHGEGVMHILFNSLMLWFVGSELEKIWGSREFLKFYLFCGVGAGLVYALVTLFLVKFFAFNPVVLSVPTVGASGAIFGLMLAYGRIFGEKIIYFMMFLPMKAKHFVMILAAIEVFSLLMSGLGSKVNNLAHIGGFIMALVYLEFAKFNQKRLQNRFFKKPGRKLKLVVDNNKSKDTEPKGPTYH